MGQDTNKKALKSGIWYTIGNFINNGIGFLTMPVFTRLLTKGEIGDYSNFAAWLSILTIVTTAQLYSTVTVAKFDFKNEIHEYIASMLVLGSGITLFFYGIVYALRSFFMPLLGFNELELHIAFLYILVCPALNMIQIKNRIEYRYKLSVALTFVSTILSVAFSLLCVLLMQDKLAGRIAGNYIPLMIFNLILYLWQIKLARKIDSKYWGYALKIAIPTIWHLLAGNLLSASDRIMIRHMNGEIDAGLYSVAYSCAIVVSILWTSMNTAWAPWAYEQMDTKNTGMLKKASKPYLLFFGFIVFCFLLISPELLFLMGGKSYLTALSVIPPVMVGYVFQFVYSLYVNIEIFHKKQNYMAIATGLAAISNVGLNFLLIPVFGYIAAAYTTLVGYMILFIMHYYFVRRMKKNIWYDTKFNFAFLGMFLILIPVAGFLYRHAYLRYLLIVCLFLAGCTVLVWLRKELLYLIKNRSFSQIRTKLASLKDLQKDRENKKHE